MIHYIIELWLPPFYYYSAWKFNKRSSYEPVEVMENSGQEKEKHRKTTAHRRQAKVLSWQEQRANRIGWSSVQI